jgi:membrane protein
MVVRPAFATISKAYDARCRRYVAVLVAAGRKAVDDKITTIAAALAFSAFLAIPSLLLIAVGVFSLAASARAVRAIVERLGTVMPDEATALVESSLTKITEKQAGAGAALVVVGFLLALWSSTGLATTLMWGLNIAYGRKETRGFVQTRVVGLVMLGFVLIAFVLVFGLLVLGPKLSGWVGDAVGAESAVRWAWRAGQWPILIVALLVVFATILYLGPDVDHARWRFLTLGAAAAVLAWLLASAGFALFVSQFGSYNKTWGSLAAVVIMLTWLWLGGLALLFGAEVNAEAERSEAGRQR